MHSPTNGSDGVECSALQNYKGYIGFFEGLMRKYIRLL